MNNLEELSDGRLLNRRDDLSDIRRNLIKDLLDHMKEDLEEEAKHKFARRLTTHHFDHIETCETCLFDIDDRMKDSSSRHRQNYDMAIKCIRELRRVQDEIEEVVMELRLRNARNSCETICPWLAPRIVVEVRR